MDSISPQRCSSTNRHRFWTVSDPPLAFWTAEFTFSYFSPCTTACTIFGLSYNFRTFVHSQAHRIAARKVSKHFNFNFRWCTTFLVMLFRLLHSYLVFASSTAFSMLCALTRPQMRRVSFQKVLRRLISIPNGFPKVFTALVRLLHMNHSFGPQDRIFSRFCIVLVGLAVDFHVRAPNIISTTFPNR